MSPIIKHQKRAIRIINKAGYCKTTNHFFCLALYIFRYCAFKNNGNNVWIKNKSLPDCRQLYFNLIGKCNLRLSIFETCKGRTNVKY